MHSVRVGRTMYCRWLYKHIAFHKSEILLSSKFVSADKSREEKRRLSPSWSTPDPKQAKFSCVDETGEFILYSVGLRYINAPNLAKECTEAYTVFFSYSKTPHSLHGLLIIQQCFVRFKTLSITWSLSIELSKLLYGGGGQGPTPYPFIYHFGRKGTTISTPFTYLL